MGTIQVTPGEGGQRVRTRDNYRLHVQRFLKWCQDPDLPTHYRVLQVNGDPRAERILKTAHDLLQELAAMIPEGKTRQSFLENVPWHREIITAWEQREAG